MSFAGASESPPALDPASGFGASRAVHSRSPAAPGKSIVLGEAPPAVDVSSIGSVADRNEMPRDFRCERNAKWSYLPARCSPSGEGVSRAKRVRLKTTRKCTLPLLLRQYASNRWSSRRSAVFALSPSSLKRSRISKPSRRQYSSQTRSCVGRLRFSVCSLALTRM